MAAEIGKDILRAEQLLKHGELVAIPTETVYGLAANALDAKAVLKIFEVKNRPHFDPLIVHIGEAEMLNRYVMSVPRWAEELANEFWPGPLTLILPKRENIPDIATSGLETVGVRMPDHEMTRDLLKRLDFPLAAPSANPFGYISPTSAQHVADQLGEKIEYILDGGECIVGLESTIVGEVDGEPTVLRLGGITVESIERVLGPVKVDTSSSSDPRNPGSLEQHYSPRLPLRFIDEVEEFDKERVGLLAFSSLNENVPIDRQVILSRSSSLEEAAVNLFAGLRKLDKMTVDLILVERFPNEGLGRAINDRLERASHTAISASMAQQVSDDTHEATSNDQNEAS
ncbi:MAG TPA: L-threonylcarbamoyladenylate synthase [Candidatus Kapabacteria bacterium]|nr:L-threonylcarbamoyladenylate synthase [Candidatus Kapabacteria bacterium]